MWMCHTGAVWSVHEMLVFVFECVVRTQFPTWACHWFRFISFKRQYVKYDNTFDNLRATLKSTGDVSPFVLFAFFEKGNRSEPEWRRAEKHRYTIFCSWTSAEIDDFNFTSQHIRKMIYWVNMECGECCVNVCVCANAIHSNGTRTIEQSKSSLIFLSLAIIFSPHRINLRVSFRRFFVFAPDFCALYAIILRCDAQEITYVKCGEQ